MTNGVKESFNIIQASAFIAIASIFGVFIIYDFYHTHKKTTTTGFYQCGPASVEAVRKGQVGLVHDVAFVLASVNAGKKKRKQIDYDPRNVATKQTCLIIF